MKQFSHIALFFLILRTGSSYPVPPNAKNVTTGFPLLVLVLSSALFLFGLFFVKWLYILRRRQAKKTVESRATLQSGWFDRFSTDSSRSRKLYIGSRNIKSGFLIGFLGSPSWETRYSAIILDSPALLRGSDVSSRKSGSGSSLVSQCSPSCSAPCCSCARSPIPNHSRISDGSLRATINPSTLLSKGRHIRPLLGRGLDLIGPPAITHGNTKSPTTYLGRMAQPSLKAANTLSGDLLTELSPAYQETQISLTNFSSSPLFSNTERTISEHCFSKPRSGETLSNSSDLSQPCEIFFPQPGITRNLHSQKIPLSPLRTLPSRPEICSEFFANSHPYHQVHSPQDLAMKSVKSKMTTSVDGLLNFMAELAQETIAWDPNIIMNENFKNLISQSKPQATLKEKWEMGRRRSLPYKRVQHAFSTLEDIPEVDVTDVTSMGDDSIHSLV